MRVTLCVSGQVYRKERINFPRVQGRAEDTFGLLYSKATAGGIKKKGVPTNAEKTRGRGFTLSFCPLDKIHTKLVLGFVHYSVAIMKRGVGHSESNSSGQPGKRRSSRGAALLAAAGSPSSSVQTGAANRTTRRQSSSTTTGAVSPHEASATMKQKGSRAAASSEARPSPRRGKKAGDAAVAPHQRVAVSSTATPRGTTAGVRKRAAGATPSPAAAAAGSTPSSSSRAAVAASTSSKKGRSGGGRGKGKPEAVMSDDSDAARKMLASLLSPVAAAREDSQSEPQGQQQVSCAGVCALLGGVEDTMCVPCELVWV